MVAFPIAFGSAAPAFDLIGLVGGWPSVYVAGAYLASLAVLSGLAAAVPGIIDYAYVVPPNSSAKKRATWHMGVNVTSLSLIALGWAFRDLPSLRPGSGTLVLEFAGLGVMTFGGWLGGTLVYRNQIGVDHRYAHAGKWKEQNVSGAPGQAVDVAAADELNVGQMKLLHVGEKRIVIARTDAGYAAFDDRCTHRGGTLADGVLVCNTVACPWHGSQFDVRTGTVKAGPAADPIRIYHIKESAGRVLLTLPGN